MSYILLQILLCLLLAGIIGAVIGWLLRGNCSKKIKKIEEECEMKMRSIEREWNTKLNYPDEDYSSSWDTQAPIEADLKNKLDDEIDIVQELPNTSHSTNSNSALSGIVATTLGATGAGATALNATSDDRLDFDSIKKLLSEKDIELSDQKIKLYDSFDVDFEKSEDLQDSYDIQAIKGINSKHAQKFKDLGIKTTTDIIKKLNNNYEDIDFVAQKLKVQSEDITSWISMADILRLPGVNPKEAQLMQTVGISSTRELGVVNIHSLHKELVELNKKADIVKEVPGINSLELWSKVAKLLG